MTKKDKERKILSYIYEINLFEIQESEEPDFIMKYKNDDSFFGVEITEYYYNETNARLDNIAGYSSSLLDGGDFLHKSDRKELDVSDITLISEDGSENVVNAIVSQFPSTNENISKLIEVLKSKNKKFRNYEKTLRHINLIVNNTERFLCFQEKKYLFNNLFTPEFVEAVIESSFHEIYFITETMDNKRLNIPLKLTLFISEYMLYQDAFFEYYGPNAELAAPEEYYYQFFGYLKRVGFSSLGMRNGMNESELFFSDYSIVINENGDGLKIRDWNDRPYNFKIDVFEVDGKDIDGMFIDYFEKYKTEFMFTGEIGFEIK